MSDGYMFSYPMSPPIRSGFGGIPFSSGSSMNHPFLSESIHIQYRNISTNAYVSNTGMLGVSHVPNGVQPITHFDWSTGKGVHMPQYSYNSKTICYPCLNRMTNRGNFPGCVNTRSGTQAICQECTKVFTI